MKAETENSYSISSLEKSFTVLEYIYQSTHNVSAIEIHSKTGIPKASLHKILQTLKTLGYIDQNEDTNLYFPTMKLLQVSYFSINRHRFFDTYYPYMMMYLRRFNLPSSLTVYSDNKPVVVYSSVGRGDIIIDKTRISGSSPPLHASSSGRLFLAYLPEETARELLAKVPLTPFTGATLCTADEIMATLPVSVQKGYCRLDGEVYYGFSNLSFPLTASDGQLIGSYNIVVPTDRLDTILPDNALQEIRDTLSAVHISLS